MKKVFGVMMLAGFPVACGTTLPSMPDVAGNAAVDNAAVSSQASRPAPAPRPAPVPLPPVDCSVNDSSLLNGINIDIVSVSGASVTLRAEGVIRDSERMTPCFVPTWSVPGRDVSLTIDKIDPRLVTLTAPSGRYVVQAVVSMGSSRVVGRALVTIK